jgi:hypothetical protein
VVSLETADLSEAILIGFVQIMVWCAEHKSASSSVGFPVQKIKFAAASGAAIWDPPEKIRAVEARHLHITDDYIELTLLKQFESLLAVTCLGNMCLICKNGID